MAQFLQNTGQDHHENWTSNQLPVPFHTVHDTLCLLEDEAGLFIILQERDDGVFLSWFIYREGMLEEMERRHAPHLEDAVCDGPLYHAVCGDSEITQV